MAPGSGGTVVAHDPYHEEGVGGEEEESNNFGADGGF